MLHTDREASRGLSSEPVLEPALEAFFISTGAVALGEMGDKTQLLAMLLAARFRRPLPIVLGILVATVLNHASAGIVGAWVAHALGPDIMRWVIGISFIAMAVWMLIPDQLDADDAVLTPRRFGVFGTTLVAFFLAEMGDKTQIATVALAAQFEPLIAVVIGTTFGMLLANVPVVLVGARFSQRLPLRAARLIAAAVFAALGLWVAFRGIG